MDSLRLSGVHGMTEGWVCAVCGASNAPMLMQCPCSNVVARGAANGPVAIANPPVAIASVTLEQGVGSKALDLSSKPSPKKRFTYQDPDFVEFWNNYPRKVGKEGAAKAWQRCINDGIDASHIIAAAQQYAMDATRDPTKTKYPQGWLNDGRFMDYDEPAEVSHPVAAVRDIDFEDEQAKRWAEEDAAIKALEALDG